MKSWGLSYDLNKATKSLGHKANKNVEKEEKVL